jgi:addiction module HigA family antidote
MHNPCHPGEVLREALDGISVTDAAKSLGVGRVALSRLLNGTTGISAEMALRLSKALGTTPEFWYTMQTHYDLWQARKKFRAKVKPILMNEGAAA